MRRFISCDGPFAVSPCASHQRPSEKLNVNMSYNSPLLPAMMGSDHIIRSAHTRCDDASPPNGQMVHRRSTAKWIQSIVCNIHLIIIAHTIPNTLLSAIISARTNYFGSAGRWKRHERGDQMEIYVRNTKIESHTRGK